MAYVVAPYGTAKSLRQRWNASAIVSDFPDHSGPHELGMLVELVSAEPVSGMEADEERLLLRVLSLTSCEAVQPSLDVMVPHAI